MDSRDLALEAAFTSMSLCERCREPGVEGTLELSSLPSTREQQVMCTLAKYHTSEIMVLQGHFDLAAANVSF